MDFLSLFLIAVSLAMDAFAVSITNGVTAGNFNKQKAVLAAACFGLFQFIMPLAGWLLGTGAYDLIASFDHWIAFVLLGFIGGRMLFETIKEMRHPEQEQSNVILNGKMIVMQGIATSIDALAIGISFAALAMGVEFSFLTINIWSACLLIGVVAFLLSLIGGLLGRKIGGFFKNKAGIIGGIILILIGVKILLEHLLG